MRLILPLLFVAVPLTELALLIVIGEEIGVLPTVALVVLTAVLGAAIVRHQGLAVLRRAKETVDAGGTPVEAAIEGVCLLIAGALLIVPGVVTDAVGLLLLVPGLRRMLARWGLERLRQSARVHVHTYGRRNEPPPSGPPVIEGDYERIDPAPKKSDGKAKGGRSGWRIDR